MSEPLIRMIDVVKVYDTGGVPFTALRGINGLTVMSVAQQSVNGGINRIVDRVD